MISAQIERCRSTYESIELLIDREKLEDSIVIFEKLIILLMDMTSLIYDLKKTKALSEVKTNISIIPDKEISRRFYEIMDLFQKGSESPQNYIRKKTLHKCQKKSCQLIYSLEKAYKNLRKDTLRTQLDAHKKRLRFQIGIILIILTAFAVLLWGASHYQELRAVAKTEADMAAMAKMAYMAKRKSGKPLVKITGSGCSLCACKGYKTLNGLSDTDPCIRSWHSAITRICRIGQPESDVAKRFLRDPWGSPYGLDENEGEFAGTDCRNDQIRSAGPDAMFNTDDDILVIVENAFCKKK